MTNANMKLVALSVVLDNQMETPAASLESGEFIVTKVVELAKLKTELEGKLSYETDVYFTYVCLSDYDRKV